MTSVRIRPPGPTRRYPGEFTLRMMRHPLEFLPDLARDHGDVAVFHVGAQPIVRSKHRGKE